MVETAPFGTWRSPITPELVAGAQKRLSFPSLAQGRVLWCEGRPEERGRVTLCLREPDGTVRELTPAPFNVRSRVHEYGGRAYAVAGDVMVAVDFLSQRIHRIVPGVAPQPITPAADGALRFADLLLDRAGERVIAVQEDHRGGGEPGNTLVTVPLGGGEAIATLVDGHDFVAAPALSPDRRRLACIVWDHPEMPWHRTRLCVVELDAKGRPVGRRLIEAPTPSAILQPMFSPEGDLHVLCDADDWWNLYRLDGDRLVQVTREKGEIGGPLWALGTSWYGFAEDGRIVAALMRQGRWRLALIDAGGVAVQLDVDRSELADPVCEGMSVALLAGDAARPAAVLRCDLALGRFETVAVAGELPVPADRLSRPKRLRFETPAGEGSAHYYPPHNPDFAPPPGELPPLIVRSHGGPTGQAGTPLRLGYQFWTSRGFALLDVDYRGSTGYGRRYRRALDGLWGIADVEDCIAAAAKAVAEGIADPRRLLIAGGSAGGYTTLCALTFHDTFRAGASHYGVGDLELLARDTHKFESRYLDRLVAPYPEHAATYRERSPLAHAARLSRPVIFFQGLEDKVVPPNQAETMVEALRAKGVAVAYLPFPGEGHGFRRAETIAAVTAAEFTFYTRILGIPAAPLYPLEIDNLPQPPQR